MSAVALERHLAAREVLAAAIGQRDASAASLDGARMAHAAAVEGLDAARAALEGIAAGERAHGLDLAQAIKAAVSKGRQSPIAPIGPDGVERARAEAMVTAATVAAAQLANELELAAAAHTSAAETVSVAARAVMAEHAENITAEAVRAFEKLRTLQATLGGIDTAAFKPGGGVASSILPSRAAQILTLDLASGSTPPGQAQGVVASWRAFKIALEADADAPAPS